VIGLVAAVGGAVAAIVGVVIAYLAWIQPHSPDSGSGPAAGSPAASTSASGIGPSPATVPGGQPGRYLTDLPPSAGAGSAVIPPGTRGVLQVRCATGQTGDRYRFVEYDLLGAYAGLTARASVAGPIRPESQAEVEVFTDGRLADNHVFSPRQQADLAAALTGAQQLRLQVTCQDPAGTVTISSALLSPGG